MFVFLWLLLLPFWMLVISEGARVFCTSITRAYRFPLGFICSVFPLCFFIRSARPLRPGQIFCGVVADLLSREPVRRPGFSARLGFLSARDFGLRFSHCVRSSCLCFGLFVCCAPVPSTPGEFVKVAILFGNCLLLCTRSPAWWISIADQRSSLSSFSGFLFSCAGTMPPMLICKSLSVLWIHLCCDLDCCRWESILFLNRRIKGSSFLGSHHTLGGGFSVTHIRCSVKYAGCFELLVDSILFVEISHVTMLPSIVVFCCVSSSLARFWGPLAFR
jgi:hypothetical protein